MQHTHTEARGRWEVRTAWFCYFSPVNVFKSKATGGRDVAQASVKCYTAKQHKLSVVRKKHSIFFSNQRQAFLLFSGKSMDFSGRWQWCLAQHIHWNTYGWSLESENTGSRCCLCCERHSESYLKAAFELEKNCHFWCFPSGTILSYFPASNHNICLAYAPC